MEAPTTRTVLVCGGRDYDRYELLRIALTTLHNETPITRVVSGAARGADKLGELWAQQNHVKVVRYPADWAQHGRAAGVLRNQHMLNAERVDLVVACEGGRGTADMIRRAEAQSIPIVRVGWTQDPDYGL